MDLRWVPHLSPVYALCVALRHEVLRRPLGLHFTDGQIAGESDSLHLACFDGEQLVGTLMLTPREEGGIQMRQVAVDERHRGQGFGRALVEESEAEARRRGCHRLFLHARDTAIPFYEALGYRTLGGTFTEVGIPHQEMVKDLT